MITLLMMLLVPIFVFAYLHSPEFAATAAGVDKIVSQIPDGQIQKQMLVPAALGSILPAGVMGLFASVIIAASIATDSTYMHLMGEHLCAGCHPAVSKSPSFAPGAFVAAARGDSQCGLFCFCMEHPFSAQRIHLYVFPDYRGHLPGRSGRGHSRGSILAAWQHRRGLGRDDRGVISGRGRHSAAQYRLAAAAKIGGPITRFGRLGNFCPGNFLSTEHRCLSSRRLQPSWLTCWFRLCSRKGPADLAKLLHRGHDAIKGEHPGGEPSRVSTEHLFEIKPARSWSERLGIGPEFTRGDRAIYYLKIGWVMFFVVVFVVGTGLNLIWPFSDAGLGGMVGV